MCWQPVASYFTAKSTGFFTVYKQTNSVQPWTTQQLGTKKKKKKKKKKKNYTKDAPD